MALQLADLKKFQNLEFLSKQLVEGFITGLHKSPFHGFSVEFAEHKLYNYGESIRHMDWKLYSRTDRLYTKQFEEETNLRAHLVIDTSSSMYYPSPGYDKIKFSIYTAAALCHIMIRQRDAVGLTAFSEGIQFQTRQRSTRLHLNNLLGVMEECLQPPREGNRATKIAEVLHILAEKVHKRSLVILFTDLFSQESTDEVYAALQHLKHKKHEVLLFQVNARATEEWFGFEDRPCEFIDVETNQSLKVNPFLIKDQYKKTMQDIFQEAKYRCGRLKVDFIEADSADPFDKLLMAYLIKRNRMV